MIPSLLFSVLLFSVGYVGMRQNFSIDDLLRQNRPDHLGQSVVTKEPAVANSAAAEATTERLKARLTRIMEDEKLYLRHDLRLDDVVKAMGASRTVVSNLINRNMGLSFSDYVNGLRVKRAQDIISERHPDDSRLFLEIMEECGFQSETSFYRSFRKHTGMTPKQWAEMGENS